MPILITDLLKLKVKVTP